MRINARIEAPKSLSFKTSPRSQKTFLGIIDIRPIFAHIKKAFQRDEVRRMPPAEIEPELLSVRQTAAWLGVSPEAIYAAINRGEIPIVRIGKLKKVSKRWLERKINDAANAP